MLDHFASLTEVWDRQIANTMKLQCVFPSYKAPPLSETKAGVYSLQCLDRSNPDFGAVPALDKGFAEPGVGGPYAFQFLFAYYSKASRFYHDDRVLLRAKYAMEFLISKVHEDGSIDLLETNFHCANTSAFTMHLVGYAYKLMNWYSGGSELENEVKALLHEYTVRSGDAMVNLGFHTPNHRWVQSAALALCFNLTGDRKYRDYLQKFLDEGIDCDAEGEYSERSAGIYNIVCDNALNIMAEELNMPELREHVMRNLKMVVKYFEPDNTMCTMNSTRQDVGRDVAYTGYYENYLFMALKTGDPELAWIADDMYRNYFHSDIWAVGGYMGIFLMMLNPPKDREGLEIDPKLTELCRALPTRQPQLDYDKYFETSGIVRMRRGDTTLTLTRGVPMFLKLQRGQDRLFLRFAGSFYGPLAQFAAQKIEKTPTGYRLYSHKSWGYKRPLETPPATPWWDEMDHSKRQSIGMTDFDVTMDIHFTGTGFDLTLDAGGCEQIPYKLEIMTMPEGYYSTPDTLLHTRAGDYVFLKQGEAEYRFAPAQTGFRIEGGFHRHNYAAAMRGAIPADPKAFTVVMTGFTAEKRSIHVETITPVAPEM